MVTFPALNPSSRTFTPGEYPHSPFSALSGVQSRVRNSNVMLSSQLRLTFVAIPEASMLSILGHYQGQQGGFLSFTLPSLIWSGVSNAADYQLSGYGWIYREPPTVEDSMCADAYDVEVTLETVPPEGTAIAGLEATVGITLAAGAAGVASAGIPGITQTVTITLAAGAASVAGVDPNFSSVSLLLHFNGSNGSTTFTDSSSKAISVTTDRGSPAISTAESQFGGASLSLVNGASLTIPSNAAFTLDADFTVEMWVKRTGGTNQYDTILCANSSESDFLIRPDGLNPLVLVGGSSFANGWTTTLNTWHHIAVARSGSTVRAYKDGASIGSATNTSTIATSGFKLGISIAGTNRFFLGYIDELRITKGAARYTGTSFTPPAAPFPDS